jgi:DNA-binding transcriptional regulator LsrR (DeoR family)
MEVARLYFQERMKASKIAKQLRIGVERVYSIVNNIKRTAKRVSRAAGVDGVVE